MFLYIYSAKFGDVLTRAFDMSFTKPRFYGTHSALSLGLHSYTLHNSRFCSFNEKSRGVSLGLTDRSGVHSLQYSGAWRDLVPARRPLEMQSEAYTGPSRSVVRDAKTSVKSSLAYTYTHNRLDNALVPFAGYAAQGTVEVASALLGGDVNCVKLKASARKVWPLTPRTSFGISAMAGALRTLGAQRSSPLDRFYYGGGSTFRGMENLGIGPRDAEDAVGGDVYAGAGARLQYRPAFAFCDNYRVVTNAFVNVANGLGTGGGTPTAPQLRRFFTDMRVCAGVGVAAPTPFGRLDVTLAYPLRTFKRDPTVVFNIGLAMEHDFL
jgi:outer membrane protein insertion porin family